MENSSERIENFNGINNKYDNKREIIYDLENSHNVEKFHNKKEELKKFSDEFPDKLNLPTMSENGGLFGLFNSKVTGHDLNSLSSDIQSIIIDQNDSLKSIFKEFNTVYETFSELDESYIQGILISLKSAEEANRKALKGIEGVEGNYAEIVKDQQDIKQLIDQNKQVLVILKNFKGKIDDLEHLFDIDQIFIEVNNLKDSQSDINETLLENRTQQSKTNEIFNNNLKKITLDNNNISEVISDLRNESLKLEKEIETKSEAYKTSIDELSQKVRFNKNLSIFSLVATIIIFILVAIGVI